MPLEDLSIGVAIGKGRFKQVHRGTLKGRALGAGIEDKDIVVLRYAKGKAECKAELQVLSKLSQVEGSSEFVPILWGACDQGRDLVVVQERALVGSLKAAIQEPEDGQIPISVAHALRIAMQISRAMLCLETAHVVHADLSCRNVLVCRLEQDPKNTLVKVTDFGLSLILKEGTTFEIRKQPMATRWCSPETVAFSRLSHRSDVWSLGTTLWELFSKGGSPWVSIDKRTEVAAKLKTYGETPDIEVSAEIAENFPIQEGYSTAAHEILLSCLKVQDRLRPDFATVAGKYEALVNPKQAHTELVPTAVPQLKIEGVSSSPSLVPRPCVANQNAGRLPLPSLSPRDPANSSHSEGINTPSTSATPTTPWPLDPHSRKQKYEDKLAALLEHQEARLARLEELAALEGHSQRHTPRQYAPIRDTVIPLSPEGVPLVPILAGIESGGSGAWTLQSLIGPSLLRKQEFMDKADAWAAFVETADLAQPCKLRDPRGFERATSAWVGVKEVPTSIVLPPPRIAAVPCMTPRAMFSAWGPLQQPAAPNVALRPYAY
jgi:serine/threonine protein kinase